MGWKDVAGIVGKAAPLVGSILGGPAGGAVGTMVASLLGTDPEPQAVAQAIQADPQALERVRQMELDHQEELTRMHLEAETTRLTEVNATMRAEAASNDPYVRRWRPTFGYAAALTWTLQVVGLACAMVLHPKDAADIVAAVTALTPMWGIALAVLGVAVHKRSQDKQVLAGMQPSGLLGLFGKK